VADLLLLSNSTSPGFGYLGHAMNTIAAMLPAGRRRVLFVPFASADPDSYAELIAAALAAIGAEVTAAHRQGDPLRPLESADAVLVGGGNTFRLLAVLQRTGMDAAITALVRDGLPYLGISAGASVASPTLRTSAEMPIVPPRSLEALALVPFQIIPHFRDADPASTRRGDADELRIEEFLAVNAAAVLGLRDGSWLRVRGGAAAIGGTAGGALFRRGCLPGELPAGSDVSALLSERPRFDAADG